MESTQRTADPKRTEETRADNPSRKNEMQPLLSMLNLIRLKVTGVLKGPKTNNIGGNAYTHSS